MQMRAITDKRLLLSQTIIENVEHSLCFYPENKNVFEQLMVIPFVGSARCKPVGFVRY